MRGTKKLVVAHDWVKGNRAVSRYYIRFYVFGLIITYAFYVFENVYAVIEAIVLSIWALAHLLSKAARHVNCSYVYATKVDDLL